MKPIASILILFLFLFAQAQERDVKKLSHEKKHKVAHGLITKKSYYNAVDQLTALVKEHPDNKKYVRNLADAYFLARDYKNAEIWYEKVLKMDGKTTTLALFKYAESQKFNGKYEEAKKNFQTFSKSKYRDAKGERYKVFAENEIYSCDYAIKNSSKKNPLDVIHLGDHVNSKYTEFSPMLKNDTTLYFASLQSDSVISVDPEESHTFHVKLLQTQLSNEVWGPPAEVPSVNSIYESNANGAFSVDRSKFYFTRCVPDHHNHMICNIYVSEIKDSVFGKPTKLKSPVNAKGYTTTQPHINQVVMGKKNVEVLFFVSNRKGTRGGLDLWYALSDGKGGFKKPLNMGKVVNTLRDEVSPYYDFNSGTMYFSSNFHFGFGGYDVFKSTAKQFGFWSLPENIGKPINTRVDDTYYTINRNTNEGFFVSNRPEGYHLTSETCCDDIYSFKFKNPFVIKTNVYVKGTKTRADSSQIVVTNRTATSLFNYSGPALTPSDTGVIADSIRRVFIDSVSRYLHSGLVKFDKKERNTILDNSFYPELKDATHLVEAEPGKEYMVYAMDKKDTVVYTFTLDTLVRNFKNGFVLDTSDATAMVYNGKKIDIIQLDLFLDAKPVPIDTPRVAAVEDEKTFTVAKLREDIKTRLSIP